MNDDEQTPHRKRSKKKEWAVRYTFIGDKTKGWAARFPSWTKDVTYYFPSKRAAEQSLALFNHGHPKGFRRNTEWRGELFKL